MMDLPDDDVGIELMNEKFAEMGVLVAHEDGYDVDPAFAERIDRTVREKQPGVDVNEPAYREAVIEELQATGIPSGFEPIVANWVVHAIRIKDWDEDER